MSTSPSGRRQIVVEHSSASPGGQKKNRVSGMLSAVGSVLRRTRLTQIDELCQERRRLLSKAGRLIVDVGGLPGLCPDLSQQLINGENIEVAGNDVNWGLIRKINHLAERVRWLDAQIAALKHVEEEEASEEIALPSEMLESEERAHQALDGVPTEDLDAAYKSAVAEH